MISDLFSKFGWVTYMAIFDSEWHSLTENVSFTTSCTAFPSYAFPKKDYAAVAAVELRFLLESSSREIRGFAESTTFSQACRALDKREYLVIITDNFCQFCIKTYVVTHHLNSLDETVQISCHNIWFQRERKKIISQLSSNTPLI